MNSTPNAGLITRARSDFHAALMAGPLSMTNGALSNSDKDNARSVSYAKGMADAMGTLRTIAKRLAGQTLGDNFEACVEDFIRGTFPHLTHLRPGQWTITRNPGAISQFEQYQHLAELLKVVQTNPGLKASLGGDYLIKPDIVISRKPESDKVLNSGSKFLVDKTSPQRSPLRESNNDRPLLHASISCKWTIRSDRSQNARTEALNLIRNRKGAVPHAVVVTAEPLPSRLGSVAYGTGDLDCIYHVALPELMAACEAGGDADELKVLIDGRRLRDISDLPLDLAT